MVDHDRLFKELLTTFFLDFLALFAPELSREVEPASVEFLEKEIYTDVVAGERHEVDLSWRTFVRHPNPVVAALMSRMRIAVGDRPRVKLECLRMLATLRLDPARTRLISGFLDTYLRLTAREQRLFASELESVPEEEKGSVMEIVTSWMEEGIEKGRQMERQQATARTLLRVLSRRFLPLPAELAARVSVLPVDVLDRLAEDLLDFSTLADLERWLAAEPGRSAAGRRRPYKRAARKQ